MAMIELKHIGKTFDDGEEFVKDFNLEIEEGEFVIFVGPSGCGKSTTLRMIAGLEKITEGTLRVEGRVMNDVPSSERNMAMVFQNYALYPHMTVAENMAYSLKIRKVPKKERREQVEKIADILGLTKVLDQKPGELSGGQKQRVAMGRAILKNPKIFLMDEPLSNLDAKLRAQMRIEIARLHKELHTTVVYVTHDQTEAMTLGTRIVVMKDGKIQQTASPAELYDKPANVFVAGFIGMPPMNIFEALCMENEQSGIEIAVGDYKIALPESKGKILRKKGYIGRNILLGVRPENIVMASKGLTGQIGVYEMLGAEAYAYINYNNMTVTIRVNAEEKIKKGDQISFKFQEDKIHLFDDRTGKRIFD